MQGTDPFGRHARMEAAMSQISPSPGAKIRNPSFALGLSNLVVTSGNSPVRRQNFRNCLMACGTRMDTQVYLIRASATPWRIYSAHRAENVSNYDLSPNTFWQSGNRYQGSAGSCCLSSHRMIGAPFRSSLPSQYPLRSRGPGKVSTTK
jgi:hypothetical protein